MSVRSFDGRTVFVTGGGGGLGSALCRRFIRAGARVGALDVSSGRLDALQHELALPRSRFHTVAVDLTDEQATFAAVAALGQQLGLPYCLINNAGVTHLRNFGADQSVPIARVMAINFQAAVHASAACHEAIVANQGLVIGISSVAGYAPLIARCGYAASKHALEGFLKTLENELHGSGASVLIVRPSFIATSIRANYEPQDPRQRAAQQSGGEDSPEVVADKIFRAAERGRRRLLTGRVGIASYWIHRLSPRFFSWLMRRRIRGEG